MHPQTLEFDYPIPYHNFLNSLDNTDNSIKSACK